MELITSQNILLKEMLIIPDRKPTIYSANYIGIYRINVKGDL